VIVRAQSAATLGAVGLLVQQVGGVQGRTLPIVEAIAADVPNASLMLLGTDAPVRHLALDRPIVGTLERTGATIGAGAARQEFGLDGSGIGVAVIDSGVTAWHDDLEGDQGTQRLTHCRLRQRRGPVLRRQRPRTHVAGIIAGNGFDSTGRRSGIAPGVRLVALKVLDANGQGRISNIIAAFDYLVAHRDSLPVRVINVSVGAQVAESYNTDVLTQAARRAVDAGFVVVVAAGNNGRRNGQSQYGSITAPGNAPWVLTVGASSHQGTIDRSDDTVAAFSSRGPTMVDYFAKPDVVAPGVGIESLSDPGSTLYTTRSSALLNGTVEKNYKPYLSLSGTSQATPVVSGTVALMLQANPALTPNAVKAILQFTSQNYDGYDALTQGAGFLNAYGAIELSRYFAQPSSVPYPSATAWSEQLIWGTHRIAGGLILPDSNAWSPNVVWGAARQNDDDEITWGQIWTPADNEDGGVWTTWGTSCGGTNCQNVEWGGPDSENVVWGSTCGGSDCTTDETWGLSDDDAIVWGTTDDDAIVWGTTCTGEGCTE
jgi:serine protease AprX